MNTKLFGQFLLEKGYVTRDQLLQGLAAQRAAAGTLGDLALAMGMLAFKEVEAIHLLQQIENKPFSQAAVDLELLTERQLADLMHPHSAERMLLGHILLAFGHLDASTLEVALEAHDGARSENDSELMANFRSSDLTGIGSTCVSILRSVFQQTVRAPVSFQPLPTSKAISASHPVWSQMIIQGKDRFIIGLQAGEMDACVIASAMLGMAVTHFDELAQDATGEFLNILTGHICANLDGPSAELSATPPLMEKPTEFIAGARPGIALQCTSDETQFSYVLARPLRRSATVGHRTLVATHEVPERDSQRQVV